MKPPCRAPVYAAMYPALAEVAREHGYTLAIHGTLSRDYDLVAIPWTDEAADADVLMRAVAEAVAVRFGGDPVVGYEAAAAPRPHGRVGYSIHLQHGEGECEAYLDLSVMPRAYAPAGRSGAPTAA